MKTSKKYKRIQEQNQILAEQAEKDNVAAGIHYVRCYGKIVRTSDNPLNSRARSLDDGKTYLRDMTSSSKVRVR